MKLQKKCIGFYTNIIFENLIKMISTKKLINMTIIYL